MWGAFARQIFAYLLTRRGKRALAFVGMLTLGFVSALLIDMQLYISASFTGTLTFILVTMWMIQYWRVKQHDRLRERARLEAAARRLAATQAREEKYDRARAAMADSVRAAGSGVVDTLGAGVAYAKSGVTNTASAVRDGVVAGVSVTAATARAGVSSATAGAARAAERLRLRRRREDSEPA
jgi:hypothetical protein